MLHYTHESARTNLQILRAEFEKIRDNARKRESRTRLRAILDAKTPDGRIARHDAGGKRTAAAASGRAGSVTADFRQARDTPDRLRRDARDRSADAFGTADTCA